MSTDTDLTTRAEAMITGLDVGLFRAPSQTKPSDRRSLLLLQNLVRQRFGRYGYVEIGSHLGGTLVPHLADPLCASVFSIDKRPESQPDERGTVFHYQGNSTRRMIETLAEHLPEAALLKLSTFDGDATALAPDAVAPGQRLLFIDGEHTNRACFSDFLRLYPFAAASGVIAFHDANLVADAILNAEAFLAYQGVPHRLLFLPETVAAILIGEATAAAEALGRHAHDRETYLRTSREGLQRMVAAHVATLAGS
ncbi:class I SAM-dependent methyltransferase [Methylobacterium sp. A54F]